MKLTLHELSIGESLNRPISKHDVIRRDEWMDRYTDELLRLPDRSHTAPTLEEERKFAAHQPKRRRWLLTWAESRLSVNEPVQPRKAGE